jgi:long-chain acyl-CoA synthetase
MIFNFIELIFAQLQRAADRVVLREIRGNLFTEITGKELLEEIQRGRSYLRKFGLVAGDRCVLLGANSIRWIAVDLALMAEGVIAVPLYSRQATGEQVTMMKDCEPSLLIIGEAHLGDGISVAWRERPHRVSTEEVLRSAPAREAIAGAPNPRHDDDLVTIIYTSGTSGEAKGVCLNVRNVTHMVNCTTQRLNQLRGDTKTPDQIFHYLPLNFAGSWILLLSALMRNSVLTLSTDLSQLSDEIRLSAPNYFLNVPTLLERVRRGVLDNLAKQNALIRTLFAKAKSVWEHQRKTGTPPGGLDALYLKLAQILIFKKINQRFGGGLRALICGSAPLAEETQLFFFLLGIPVLQVYGLTETTAICTMDDPKSFIEPGYVGEAIPGIEMKVGPNDEILTRGPHIFPGYWNRPQDSRVMSEGWFHTGDQGQVNQRGNWRISGRLKNLVILASGHNVAPEPIEEKIGQNLTGTPQVVIIGNGRGYLCALITGTATSTEVSDAIAKLNADMPHYRQVRNFKILTETFTPENGLLTANGKLRREAIDRRFASEIATLYGVEKLT